MDLPFGLDPYKMDPGAWGASLLYNAEFVLGCFDAAKVTSVAEVGAYAGDLTRLLLLWAEQAGATVVAIDPSPHPELEQLESQRSELTLVRETSVEALEHIPMTDAIILDGDHNYYTVSEELRQIWDRVQQDQGPLPLLLLHDVCWPHGRRDDYFSPEAIPTEHRQPVAPESGLYPGVEGTRYGGLPYHWPAAHEGGPGNGVLTALEDFIAQHDELRLAVVPTFFGLGVVWAKDAPYASALEQLLGPWDRNPLIERLERNRVLHLASSQVQLRLAMDALKKVERQERLLQRMLDSRVFSAAEIFLRVRQRGKPVFSKREVRDVMAPRG